MRLNILLVVIVSDFKSRISCFLWDGWNLRLPQSVPARASTSASRTSISDFFVLVIYSLCLCVLFYMLIILIRTVYKDEMWQRSAVQNLKIQFATYKRHIWKRGVHLGFCAHIHFLRLGHALLQNDLKTNLEGFLNFINEAPIVQKMVFIVHRNVFEFNKEKLGHRQHA